MGCSYSSSSGYNNGHGCPYLGYGSGGCQTWRYSERVCYNGDGTFPATSTSACLDNYPLFAINTWSGSPMSGLMGYAPTCEGQPDCTAFVEELYQQSLITAPQLGFNLGQTSFWLKNMTASAFIGGYDSTYINGQISWVETYSNWYWAPVATTMTYGGTSVDSTHYPSSSQLANGNY